MWKVVDLHRTKKKWRRRPWWRCETIFRCCCYDWCEPEKKTQLLWRSAGKNLCFACETKKKQKKKKWIKTERFSRIKTFPVAENEMLKRIVEWIKGFSFWWTILIPPRQSIIVRAFVSVGFVFVYDVYSIHTQDSINNVSSDRMQCCCCCTFSAF